MDPMNPDEFQWTYTIECVLFLLQLWQHFSLKNWMNCFMFVASAFGKRKEKNEAISFKQWADAKTKASFDLET